VITIGIARCVTVIVLAATLGLWSFAPTQAGAASARPKPPQGVSTGDLRTADADVEVFMEPDATAEQTAGVRRKVKRSVGVVRFAYVTQQAAYRELKRAFRDEPEKAKSIDPATVRPSFRMALRHKDQSFSLIDELQDLPGVNEVTSRAADELGQRCRPRADIEVFMKVDAAPDEVAAVGTALQADNSVATVGSISKEHALEIFRCLFAEHPDLAQSVDASAFSAAFEVTIRPGEDLQAVKQRAELLPGVDEVAIRGLYRPSR
jgi:cell division protein FtsX